MDTTIEHQLAIDEALVPTAQRLKIGRSNFLLLSDIKSKESTLQLIYDVLCRCPFFNAFLVTADVPKIYMQEFWATATVHYHSIRFKMDTKKHIIFLESFRDILHICPRVPGQPFAEPPFEEEILGHSAAIRTLTNVNINKLYQTWRSFASLINKCLTRKSSGYDSLRLSQAQILWGLYHKRNIDYAYLMWEDFVYQVEHKNQKKRNEMYYPRFTKAIFHHFMSKDPSIPRRNKVNWHYVRNDFMDYKAYKEYYGIATGEAAPKPKASVRRTRSSSDTSITPPTAAASPRLKASTKGKQPAKASKAKNLSALLEPSGSGADEGIGSKPGVPDVPSDESEEELSWNSTDDEGDDNKEQDDDGDEEDEGDDGEEGNGDDDDADQEVGRGLQGTLEVKDTHVTLTLVKPNGMESIFETKSRANVQTPPSVAPLFITTPTMTSSTIATTTTSQAPNLPTKIPSDIIQNLPSFGSLFCFDDRLRTSYVLAADLSEMELKKILIEKMEGNKSIQRSDEQRNLYKALVDAYESDKIILDTYDRGSKRRKEGKEPESASAPSETATKSAGRSTTGSKSRQASAIESAFAEEPQADSRSFFNELMDTPLDFSNFIMNRLRVDTLTLKLLAGPTYDLMKGSCKSLIELEYHLEEVYKATTNQLDWVNPEVQQYPHNLLQPLPLIPDNRGHRVIPFAHFINNDLDYLRGGASSRKYTTSVTKTKAADYEHIKWIEDLNKDKKDRLMRIDELHKFSDETLTDVRTALDDHLKGIQMRYLPQTIWRKSDKDRAAAMIQAIDKRLKTRKIMRSLEMFVGGRLYEGDFRMLQRTI
nr:hypothetical protein [Tanacetum cinerariifolium]